VNRDDIIRMAREAGSSPAEIDIVCRFAAVLDDFAALVAAAEREACKQWFIEDSERFAAQVALAEREACANLAEETVCDTHLPTGVKIYGWRVSKAIRARSTP
jgi:hypothetical protein